MGKYYDEICRFTLLRVFRWMEKGVGLAIIIFLLKILWDWNGQYNGLILHIITRNFLVLACFRVIIVCVPVQKLIFSILIHNPKTL